MAGRKRTAAAGGSTKQKKEQEQYLISELDQYLFGQGTHYDIFRKLGAHPMTYQGKKGTAFAVWAPNAKSVHVIGTFNEWDETSHKMIRRDPLGIYELFVPDIGEGELYKFLIETQSGQKLYKADPFANSAFYRQYDCSRAPGAVYEFFQVRVFRKFCAARAL